MISRLEERHHKEREEESKLIVEIGNAQIQGLGALSKQINGLAKVLASRR